MFDAFMLMRMPMVDLAEVPKQSEPKAYNSEEPWSPQQVEDNEGIAISFSKQTTPQGKLRADVSLTEAVHDDDDSFAGNGAPTCDDLLDVDQEEIHVMPTVPYTIYAPSSSACAVSVESLDDDDDDDDSTATSNTTSVLSKLLHSMERTSETQRALKRRRLCNNDDVLLHFLQQTEESRRKLYNFQAPFALGI